MITTKTLAFNKEKILTLVQFSSLLAVATIAPFFLQQAIVGPAVNATLFISVVLLGSRNAMLIGILPSLVALSTGLLPPVLAPMIPFIMTGNVLLILVFSSLIKKNYWLGMVTASILKFVFLFGASSIVIDLLLNKDVAPKVAMIMSYPQLFTALSGGLIAFLFLRAIKKV